MKSSGEDTLCPVCGFNVPAGVNECPNCGTELTKKMSEPPPAQPGAVVSVSDSLQVLMEMAHEQEMAGDLQGALETYRHARSFGVEHLGGDDSIQLTVQVLETLIQRTEEYLRQRGTSKLPITGMDDETTIPGAPSAAPVEVPAGLPAILPGEAPVMPETFQPIRMDLVRPIGQELDPGGRTNWKLWITLGALAVLLCLGSLVGGGLVVIGRQGRGPLASLASATPTPSPTITPTPTTLPGATQISPRDAMVMVHVPAGKFRMGSDDFDDDEKPAHTVFLDAFYIDRTEVTNAMYSRCVLAGSCQPPESADSSTHVDYYNNLYYASYPVINVNWEQANTYCLWAGRRLPTEAEWEKAARGLDGRTYPWGNENPSASLLNFRENVGDTTEVGNYPAGVSPNGALDMSGNVWEWVADWYDASYYAHSPQANPLGPASGTYRIIRGGSWVHVEEYMTTFYRYETDPSNRFSDVGFRCARSAP